MRDLDRLQNNAEATVSRKQAKPEFDTAIATTKTLYGDYLKRVNSITFAIYEIYRETYPDIASEKLLELAVLQTPVLLNEVKHIVGDD